MADDVVHTARKPRLSADVYIRVDGAIELRPPRAMTPLARLLRTAVLCPAWKRRDNDEAPSFHEEVWELVAPASLTHGIQVFREVGW